ncbi:cobalamin B12-binding domain-containing protein [Holophaga foetida]|uniref:cobalamin B12-binding domain-containing protein n=1 Tax=Holophaga foetida TaxID=35839 RepID=UPI00024745DE|nr:cobalamin-dependent protein [Holophaga foetida]
MSQTLINAMADLDESVLVAEVNALKSQGAPALEIIQKLQEGMNIVGKRYEEKEYYLSELIMSAEIFKEAAALIGGDLAAGDAPSHGTFVMGTIYGDIHDIGKNIVTTVMSCNGFRVIDLGVDVSTAAYIEAIREHKPQVVGISCLLTTAFDGMKECISSIEAAGLRDGLKILIGGGPCDQTTADYVGADAYCKTAQDSVEYSKKLMGVK